MQKMNKLRLWSGWWIGLLLLGTVACSDSEATGQTPAETSTEQATAPSVLENVDLARFQELRKDPQVQVLDVRTPGEVAAGRIAGAVAINIHDPQFDARVREQLDASRPVAVYCQSGGRSSRAARQLQSLEFGTVYNYLGGVGEWRGSGLPLER